MNPLESLSHLTVILFVLLILPAGTQVVARYTFDGLAADGEVSLRLNSQDDPFPGADYVPDPQQGESGPRLVNLGGGGAAAYYRPYYNHAGSEGADGLEVLELRTHHSHFQDVYQTAEGDGPLPAGGSFTWEAVVRIDEFDGASHMGVPIDASRGTGRVMGWTNEGRMWPSSLGCG